MIKELFCGGELKKIKELEKSWASSRGENINLNKEIDSIKKANRELEVNLTDITQDRDRLSFILEGQIKEKNLENELNSKYPSVRLSYPCRWYNNQIYSVDVRNFFTNPDCNELQDIIAPISNLTDDEKALKCLQWVIKNIKSESDSSVFKHTEYWAYAEEVLHTRRDDCDGFGVLIANLMVASGIPYYKVRINAGEVFNSDGTKAGSHCYCVYYVESKKYWVVMDGCWWVDSKTSVTKRNDYKASKTYGGENSVWFSFNSKFCFKK